MFFEIPAINRQGLRRFGITMGVIIALLFGLILPWLWGHHFAIWPWAVALFFWTFSLFLPGSLRPIYNIWMRIGGILGYINTHIILGIVFYVLVTPMSLYLRFSGQDPMMRGFDLKSYSYRKISSNRDPLSMEKPY